MKTQVELEAEHRLLQTRRRRGVVLKLIRSGHQTQLSRMDDFELWTILLKMGTAMGRDQVRTMLQDLQTLGYIDFASDLNEDTGKYEMSQIELTAAGLRFMSIGRGNEDVELR
jgi:hypothetical protein